MGQEHYVSVTLADLIRQSHWVLVAEYLGSEKRTKPCAKQEYSYAVGQLKIHEVVYVNNSWGRTVTPPGEPQMLDKVEVGQTLYVAPPNAGRKFELHKMYYEEGRSKSPIYESYGSSVQSIVAGEKYIFFVQSSGFDMGSLEYCMTGSYESMDKMNDVKDAVVKLPSVPPPSRHLRTPPSQNLPPDKGSNPQGKCVSM